MPETMPADDRRVDRRGARRRPRRSAAAGPGPAARPGAGAGDHRRSRSSARSSTRSSCSSDNLINVAADHVGDRPAGAGPDDRADRREDGPVAGVDLRARPRRRGLAGRRRPAPGHGLGLLPGGLGDPGHAARRRARRRGQRAADRPVRAQRLHRHARHADRAARPADRHLRRPDLLRPAGVDALPRHDAVARGAGLDLDLPGRCSPSAIVVLGFTSFGRALYAIGGNVDAARAAGIRTDRVLWIVIVTGERAGRARRAAAVRPARPRSPPPRATAPSSPSSPPRSSAASASTAARARCSARSPASCCSS